ncbi:uncharacterized protein LTHEOB_6322 [Neofusicoccum parvum]|nr:uncharacterized protein LTHEOB_6322 [Neofusicoccum parvum]
MLTAVTSAFQSFWNDVVYNGVTSPSSVLHRPSSIRRPSQPTYSPITQAFTPSPYDVQHARLLLVRGLGLPVEIVDLVIDAAQYWPIVVGTTTAVGTVPLRSGSAGRGRGGVGVGVGIGGSGVVRSSDTRMNQAAQLVVVTGAVPADEEVGEEGPGWEGLRKVKVQGARWWTRSRDQGWVSEGVGRRGTYSGSSSWFDACILRPLDPSIPRPPLNPEVASRIEQMMQRNLPLSSEFFPHFLIGNLLSHDPEDARELFCGLGWDFVERVERVEVDGEVGERRGVLWKVQANVVAGREYTFPGWVNDVDEVKVEIRYSV